MEIGRNDEKWKMENLPGFEQWHPDQTGEAGLCLFASASLPPLFYSSAALSSPLPFLPLFCCSIDLTKN